MNYIVTFRKKNLIFEKYFLKYLRLNVKSKFLNFVF